MDKQKCVDCIKTIKQEVSMLQIMDMYGFYPAKGHTTMYHCPFHGEDKKPSASISKGFFKCFACGLTLDQVEFVVKMENCSNKKAIMKINDYFNLRLFNYMPKKEYIKHLNIIKERQRQQEKKDRLNKFINNKLKSLHFAIRYNEHITEKFKPPEKLEHWSEYASHKFFKAQKLLAFLNWIVDVLTEQQHPTTEYDYIYGNDKTKLARLLYNRKVKML